ncbi:uncharacterized protein Pyn_16094 [Prunus yedoensis var. nudiflora]|uniref:J domain-containing protein n=1 Tax=Prunus yedoensis var. nudiflora TaxID=2094558 RepID=A0A314YY95_PRUYE|nr:uncharacterized protein Pyn_16094 [Prunus yedoensis var. nudiflora]
MEFHFNTNRAEAERWLSTAVKLLTTRDLHGTKSFAIRARESDPRLEATEQIIAVADTLLAGDSRISGHSQQPDWYAILQLAHYTQNLELVATQYRRLALLLNPHRNRFPYADHAFRLVSEAWNVLSNPSKKALYDHELSMFNRFDSAPSGSTQLSKDGRVAMEEERPSLNNVTESTAPPSESTAPPSESTRPVEASPPSESTRPESEPRTESFWTACPYCYNLFEYPSVYEDCMLRCQNCKRAFNAVVIEAPPVTGSDGEVNFCCWGYFRWGGSAEWTPFSTMFACPIQGKKKNAGRTKNANSGPRVYIDDDEALLDISDSSEESDDEWQTDRRKRRAVKAKGKASVAKTPVRASDRIRKGNQNVGGQGKVGSGGSLGGGSVSKPESSKKSSSSARKRGAAALGKLDLNVEFSNNEVEEPAAQTMSEGNGTANGEEDNIEGISFFEGLDEFLSSLPILNVVGDDKVKAN